MFARDLWKNKRSNVNQTEDGLKKKNAYSSKNVVSWIQKRYESDVELYISDNPDLYNYLLENKADIETTSSLPFDRRELPERKASSIVLKKSVQFGNKNLWKTQFEWLVGVMVKIKTAFCKHISNTSNDLVE